MLYSFSVYFFFCSSHYWLIIKAVCKSPCSHPSKKIRLCLPAPLEVLWGHVIFFGQCNWVEVTHVTSRGNFKSQGVLHHTLPVSSAVIKATMSQTVAAPSGWISEWGSWHWHWKLSTYTTYNKHVAQARNKPLFPSTMESWGLFVTAAEASPISPINYSNAHWSLSTIALTYPVWFCFLPLSGAPYTEIKHRENLSGLIESPSIYWAELLYHNTL